MGKKTPTYRKHKPSGQAIVVFDGRTHYLGKWNSKSSREAYHRLLAEWEANGRQAYPPEAFNPADKITVAEVLLRYWRFAATYYSKGDGERPKEMARIKSACRPWKDLYGATPLCEFGPLALKAVRTKFIEGNLSRGQVNAYIGVIKRVVKWAVAEELIEPTVYQGLAAVAGLRRGRAEVRETESVRPVPDARVDAIQPYVPPPVWAAIELQRLTGMRPGEVLAMRGCDLDVTGDLWLYRPAQHKTAHHGHERLIDLGPRAKEIIRPLLRTDIAAFLFSPVESEEQRNAERKRKRESPMTPSQAKRKPKRKPVRAPGQRYSVASYRRAITRGCDRAYPPPKPLAKQEDETATEWQARLSVKQKADLAEWQKEHRWAPHQLRHSFATKVRKRYGLEASRALLGHRSMVTSETYAELDRAKVAHIVQEVG